MERTTAAVPLKDFFLLSSLQPSRAQKQLALGVTLALLVIFFLAAGPFSRIQTSRVAAFVPAYATALVLTEGLTAYLLFSQFAIFRTRALLAISSGYLFTALMVIAWLLMFPGVFASEGVIGGIQGRAYIYFFWHAGFPIFVMVYALTKDADPNKRYWNGTVRAAIVLSVVVTAGIVSVLTFFLSVQNSALPRVELDPLRFSPLWMYFAVPMASLIILALLMLWVRRRSILDLWLLVVMCAYGIEIWLSYFPLAIAYGFGWYASRIFGLFSSSLVLLILLYEITMLYAQERLRQLESDLAHMNRLSMMGELSASIAHEVNQPIAATVTNAQAALRWLGAKPPNLDEAQDALRDIVRDGNRAGAVVGRIRNLSKRTAPRDEFVEINAAIRDVMEITHSEAVKNSVSVRTELVEGLPLVQGDRVELQQVILNLILNALEAMREMGEGPREVLITTGKTESDDVLVAMRDSGPGLAPAALEHLFEAFHTTKSNGLGLGLSICRSIIEGHGGRLWASANPPRGAVFQFTLPAHAHPVSASPAAGQ